MVSRRLTPDCIFKYTLHNFKLVYALKTAYYLENHQNSAYRLTLQNSFFNQHNVLKHSLFFSIGGLCVSVFFGLLAGCDDISSQPEAEPTSLNSLTISPNRLQFDASAPIGTQVVPFDITVTLDGPPNSDLHYSVERRGEVASSGTLDPQSDRIHTTAFSLTLNTAESMNFTVHVFADGRKSDRLRGSIRIRGRSVSRPVILEAFNTEEVTIPDSGNERIDFFARVTHPEDQDFIDRVQFFLIDQQGNRLGDEFELFDDGELNNPEGRIDEAAGDSLYSRALFIEPTNNPDNVDVFYYAVGVDGQSSDTTQTELQILE